MASLQDDNLNVSSSLASLSVHCTNEITALLTNLTDLHKKVGAVEAMQNRLEANGGEEESSVHIEEAAFPGPIILQPWPPWLEAHSCLRRHI